MNGDGKEMGSIANLNKSSRVSFSFHNSERIQSLFFF
jgi:hypothetical protein